MQIPRNKKLIRCLLLVGVLLFGNLTLDSPAFSQILKPQTPLSPLQPGMMPNRASSSVAGDALPLRQPPSRNTLVAPLLPNHGLATPASSPQPRVESTALEHPLSDARQDPTSRLDSDLDLDLAIQSQPRSMPRSIGGSSLLKSTGNLCDVHFINESVGVAVGSHGLIWRSIDGGRNWNSCVCPTDCDLVSVTFASDLEGWAVGGRALPVKGLHEGIVLKTTDGGLTWKKLQTILLPRLIDVQVTKSHRLWATSIATHQYPQRVFESLDGGHSWNDIQFRWPSSANSKQISQHTIQTESVGLSPAWHTDTRSVVSTSQGVFSIADNTAIYSEFDGVVGSENMQFRSVVSAGKKVFAVTESGKLLVSLDQGDRWLPIIPMLPPAIASAANGFVLATALGGNAWFLQQGTSKILHYRESTNSWTWQTIPQPAPIQSMYFTDNLHGWAVGPLGNVFRTMDGGEHWNWEHSLHSHLAVLVVAPDTSDIPPVLMTQLAANNHLVVGVLCAKSDLPLHLFRDSLSTMDAGWITVNRAPFDSTDRKVQRLAIDQCLSGLRPQILLICPPTSKRSGPSVLAKDWIAAAQEIRKYSPVDHRNQWGTMGLTVELAIGVCDSSTSLEGYAPALQQLLGDAVFESNLLIQQWQDETETRSAVYRDSIGIRRIASAGPNELLWFSSVGKLEPNSLNIQLSRFVGTHNPVPVFSLAQQSSYKQTWINSFSAATTTDASLRSVWVRSLIASLGQVPEASRVNWLIELAEACHRLGDHRKACLAWLEAWNSGTDEISGLYALTRAMPLLCSDEMQWSNRQEATELAQQELLAMEQRMQQAMAAGQTTEEAKFDEALRRWGINPEEKDRVPPNILSRIKAMEQLRESKKNQAFGEKEETLIEIPNFQTFANIAPATVKQFDDRDGNKLTRNSTVVSWEASQSTASNTVSQATHSEAATTTLPLTMIDRLPDERINHAFQLAKLAEGLWPHLQSDSSWWKLKARLARDMGDIPQVESAWNRVLQYSEATEDEKAMALFEKLIATFGSSADERGLFAGEVAQVTSIDNSSKLPTRYHWPANWAMERPNLDGKLDEALWVDSVVNEKAKVAFSHDEQYFYMGIVTFAAGNSAENTSEMEPEGNSTLQSVTSNRRPGMKKIVRDSANEKDAVRIHIDTDRDYQTDFVLCFDKQGRVTERQGNDKSWNPTMYLAQDRSADKWTLEIAIDLADLSLPRLGEYWHLRVEQTGSTENAVSGWTRIRDPMEILPQ